MNSLGFGGYRKIYLDLVNRLENEDIHALAEPLNLPMTDTGEVETPFLDTIYLISRKGVQRSDRKGFLSAAEGALIHYL